MRNIKMVMALVVISMLCLSCSACSKKPSTIEVDNTSPSIKAGIEYMISYQYGKKVNVTIQNTADVGMYKAVVFTTNDKTIPSGDTELVDISNGKYRVTSVTCNNLLTEHWLINDDKKDQYELVIFKKYNIKPSKIKFNLAGKELTFDVPSSDYGIKFQKIDKPLDSDRAPVSMIKFYDENNVDITDKIKLAE